MFSKQMFRMLVITSLAATVVAMPSTGYAGSASADHPIRATTALQAVRILLRPFDPNNDGKFNFGNCTNLSPKLHPDLVCPETARLRHYLSVRRLPMGDSGLPFCRCQSVPFSVRVAAVRFNNGRLARVDVHWVFGPTRSSPSQRMHFIKTTDTFVVRHQAGSWLVDDEYCAGRPATSVYNGVAGQRPCFMR